VCRAHVTEGTSAVSVYLTLHLLLHIIHSFWKHYSSLSSSNHQVTILGCTFSFKMHSYNTPLSECTTSAFVDEPRRMLRIIKRFGKHYSCHLQGEYVMVGCFWKPYIGQAEVASWI
jgi:hypothetical protein